MTRSRSSARNREVRLFNGCDLKRFTLANSRRDAAEQKNDERLHVLFLSQDRARARSRSYCRRSNIKSSGVFGQFRPWSRLFPFTQFQSDHFIYSASTVSLTTRAPQPRSPHSSYTSTAMYDGSTSGAATPRNLATVSSLCSAELADISQPGIRHLADVQVPRLVNDHDFRNSHKTLPKWKYTLTPSKIRSYF
jgi:hypothetical protein